MFLPCKGKSTITEFARLLLILDTVLLTLLRDLSQEPTGLLGTVMPLSCLVAWSMLHVVSMATQSIGQAIWLQTLEATVWKTALSTAQVVAASTLLGPMLLNAPSQVAR